MDTESEQMHPDIEQYGDEYIATKDAPVPRWLTWNYYFWIAFGIVWFYFFWNGSYGWLDRGYWQELQRAAQTTFPFNTSSLLEDKPPKEAGLHQKN